MKISSRIMCRKWTCKVEFRQRIPKAALVNIREIRIHPSRLGHFTSTRRTAFQSQSLKISSTPNFQSQARDLAPILEPDSPMTTRQAQTKPAARNAMAFGAADAKADRKRVIAAKLACAEEMRGAGMWYSIPVWRLIYWRVAAANVQRRKKGVDFDEPFSWVEEVNRHGMENLISCVVFSLLIVY